MVCFRLFGSGEKGERTMIEVWWFDGVEWVDMGVFPCWLRCGVG